MKHETVRVYQHGEGRKANNAKVVRAPNTPATPPHTAFRCGGSSAVGGRPLALSMRSFSVSYVLHVVPLYGMIPAKVGVSPA